MWPFSELGMDPVADERAVKRAYAARLKLTRPEDDAEAFQSLVAARDRAIQMIRAGWTPAPRPPAWDDDEDDEDEVETEDRSGIPVPSETGAARDSRPATAVDLSDTTGGILVPAEPLGHVAGPAPSASAEPATAPEAPFRPVEPPAEAAPAPREPPRLATSRAAIEAGIRERLERLATIQGLADEGGWRRLVDALEDLDFTGRLSFETGIAIRLDGLLRGMPTSPETDRVIALVSDAFGWSADSRRLARLIGRADRCPLVVAVERLGYTVPPRWTEDGFPLVEPADIEAYLGSGEHRLVAYYAKARATQTLPLGWSWTAFLFPAGWAAWRASMALAAAASFVIVAIVGRYFEPLETADAARAFTAFLAALLVGRAGLALVADRLQILRLARLVARADAKHPGRGEARREWLAARRRSGILVGWAMGAAFFVLVDLYGLGALWSGFDLGGAAVERVTGEKDPSLFEKMRVAAFLQHRNRVLGRIDEILEEARRSERGVDLTAFRQEARASIRAAGIDDYWGIARHYLDRAMKLRDTPNPIVPVETDG
jgi:hypothetical protein